MSLVHPTDRDLLTALGQNNIDLHQIRVPGLEFGTGQHYSTSGRGGLTESSMSVCFVPNASVGIFFAPCWYGTVSSRARRTCCQAQQIGIVGLTFTTKRSIQIFYRSGCGSGRVRGESSPLEKALKILYRVVTKERVRGENSPLDKRLSQIEFEEYILHSKGFKCRSPVQSLKV